jgi:uncharacterized membrane protein
MDIFSTIFLLFLAFPAFCVLLGLHSLVFRPFSWVFLIATIALFCGARRLWQKRNDLSIMLIPPVSLLSLWISVFVSAWVYRLSPYRYGGFPIRNFIFPSSSMGSDYIPVGMWPGFFLNMLFWIAVSVFAWWVIFRMPSRKKRVTTRLVLWMSVLSAVVSLGSLGFLVVQFD